MVTLLTLILAFHLPDEMMEKLALKIINLSFLLFGPLLFTFCLYECTKWKSLTTVCGYYHIIEGVTNYFVLFFILMLFVISIFITYSAATEKVNDLAT